MAVERKLMTAEELWAMPNDGMRHELVEGELRTMPPTGWEHGRYEVGNSYRLSRWLDDNPIGELGGGDVLPGFRMRLADLLRRPGQPRS